MIKRLKQKVNLDCSVTKISEIKNKMKLQLRKILETRLKIKTKKNPFYVDKKKNIILEEVDMTRF